MGYQFFFATVTLEVTAGKKVLQQLPRFTALQNVVSNNDFGSHCCNNVLKQYAKRRDRQTDTDI
jgi:hypothetical protein